MFKQSVLSLALLTSITVHAESGDVLFGVGAGITQGTGFEIGYELQDSLDVRGVFYNGSLAYTEELDDISYSASLKTKNTGIMLDYYPTAGRSFRLVAGAVKNGNNFTLSADAASEYKIGDETYTAAEVGSLQTQIDFNGLASYLGMGYSMHATDRFSLNLEVGVLLQGSPKLNMSADGSLASDPDFKTELEEERKKAEADLTGFKYLPTAKVMLSYKF